jgi:hypothetical protein
MAIDSVHVLVVSLEDIIRLKRTAGRPKDLVEIPSEARNIKSPEALS